MALCYFLTYLLTGILFLLQAVSGLPAEFVQLPQIGPALAALIFLALEGNSIGSFFRHGFRLRLSSYTILMTIAPLVIIPAVSVLTTRYWGVDNINTQISASFFFSTILAATCEEIGWRGYMLARLQSSMSPARASLVLGILWGLWHVPKLLMGAQFFALWFIGIMGLTYVLTSAFNRTGGSILAVTLIHSTVNLVVYYTLLGFSDPRVNLLHSCVYVFWALALAASSHRLRRGINMASTKAATAD